MFEEQKEEILFDRSKLGNSFRYVTFKFRSKRDLVEFSKKVNRQELKSLDKKHNKAHIVWDKTTPTSLDDFL